MGHKGRACGDRTGLAMGCLQGKPKAETEMDLHDLGKNNNEVTEE